MVAAQVSFKFFEEGGQVLTRIHRYFLNCSHRTEIIDTALSTSNK